MAPPLFAKLEALAFATVKVNPDSNSLPGVSSVEKLLNGLAKYILLACLAGGLIGIAQWVLGQRAGNYSQADAGRQKVLLAAGGAFLVGALPAIINFFEEAGGTVR